MPPPIKQSLWDIHKQKWGACTLCPLCEVRNHVVLARGKLPCAVLFIGEAPGPSEDKLGKPFIGPAGKLLDRMIQVSGVINYRMAFTNLTACIPKGEDGDKFTEPPKESILACAPRLLELIEIAQPRVIVTAGALADKWISKIAGLHHAKGTTSKSSVKGSSTKQGRAGKKIEANKRGMAVQASSHQRAIERASFFNILHPAAILRADITQKGLAIQQTVATLVEVVEFLKLERSDLQKET